MTKPQDLQDDELLALSFEWRRRVLRGVKDARAYANALASEVRSRFGPARDA
ncbi:hypothetical protein [Variovorax sp. PAMC 28711]|uniref:hypothetical protein n=1 Tax=Variovorax sp. PAMC 28711 TaxID=1795631 RepID=UPI0012E75A34|nr:hypothetical protein [Variovorax sp. PAMC 28711]